MTNDQLHALVESTPNKFLAARFTVDWGSNRGQGKRIGRMVMGAMSSAVFGKQTYLDPFAQIPGIDEGESGAMIRVDCMSLRYAAIIAYLKCRSAGFSHEVAMRYTYEINDDAPAGLAAEYHAKEAAG